MSKANKLAKGISVYSIGNLGSKLITFLLVPLYTYYIKPDKFGYFDVSITVIFFSIPFITLQLRDGVFRFLLSETDESRRSEIISSVYKVIFWTTLVVSGVFLVVSFFYKIDYFYYILSSLVVYAFYEVQIQIVRGLGKNVVFVTAGITTSFIICVCSFLFLVVFKTGINGLYMANITARLVSLIVIEFRMRIFSKYFRIDSSRGELARRLIKYSLPLLPNVIAWWLINGADRLFIEKYLGISANGMYAVSIKFATILVTVANIFYQAWQEVAILEYNSPDRDRFFSKVFNNYYQFLAFSSVIFALVVKIIYPHIISKAYSESRQYVFILLLAAVFSALSSFLDLAYQCSLKTYRTLPSIIGTAVLSIILNYFLVRVYGMNGIICSVLISYFVLFVYRMFDTREFFTLKVTRNTWLSNLAIVAGGVLFYRVDNNFQLIASLLVIVIFGLLMQRAFLTELFLKFTNRKKA